tara:strand:- start:893 stop:1216 length:324 start_codon:yes stop_codon:yes gene_type:complete
MMTDRTAAIPAAILAKMAPDAAARAIANATLTEATAAAGRYLVREVEIASDTHTSSGKITARIMADESGYALDVCAEALRRLADAGQAIAEPFAGITWYRLPTVNDF